MVDHPYTQGYIPVDLASIVKCEQTILTRGA